MEPPAKSSWDSWVAGTLLMSPPPTKRALVPIVRETGGLKDTVRPYNEYENTGDGFSFANYNGEEMLGVVNYAKHIYFDKKKQWNQIVERGMANDYSWKSSKGKYEGLYNYLLGYTV